MLKGASHHPIVTQREDCVVTFPANLILSYHAVERMEQNLIAWAMDFKCKWQMRPNSYQQMPAAGWVGGDREPWGLGQTPGPVPWFHGSTTQQTQGTQSAG